MSRREFVAQAAAAGVAGAVAPSLPERAAAAVKRQPQSLAPGREPLDLAECSQFFIGVESATVPRGTLANGAQMYVEYQIPVRVRHPHPIVLVHGGWGQGTDWMSTPDGRDGWVNLLLRAGYKVYVIDRPAQGRPPFAPQFHGVFVNAATYEQVSRLHTASEDVSGAFNPYSDLHTQWPGSGVVGDPALDQLMAAQGQGFEESAEAEGIWRPRGVRLLEEIGPSVLLTHGGSSAFAWVVADERPDLVRAVIALEPLGSAFRDHLGPRHRGSLSWGLTSGPVSYEPPAASPAELTKQRVKSEVHGGPAYLLQAAPARKLKNLVDIPIAVVTAEASAANLTDPGTVAFLRQAGCNVEHLRLGDMGIHGNGHFMMMEKNNREVLRTILVWLDRHTSHRPLKERSVS